jgi:hypothetical protein
MAITTANGLSEIAGMLAAYPPYAISKSSIANQAAGTTTSLWRATGTPAQGAVPTTFATCDNALLGGISIPNPGALKGYVNRWSALGATIGTWILFDRLAHMGGLSGIIVTPTTQTVNVDLITAAAAGRCAANGSDVQWFVEIYTDLGSTGVNLTANYNNQADAAQSAAVIALGATPRAGRIYQIIPNAGDSIKKVTTVVLSATTGTAGNFGVTARKRLCSLGQGVANIAPPGDFSQTGCPEFKATSCLEICVQCSATSTGILGGEINLGVV